MNDLNGFILGSYDSRDFGLIMTAPPPVVFAERDVESLSVAWRSGDLTRDNGRYKNVSVEYECAILPDDSYTLREAVVNASGLLHPTAAYRRLENTYHPESFRMARISAGVSVESIVEQAGVFTLEFDCKPQRFLKSGEQPICFTAPGVLRNPTDFPAKPLIAVYSSGAGTVTVNGTTVEIKDSVDSIPTVLDCEIQSAYGIFGGATLNFNSHIYAPEFPELQPGNNEISWTGGVIKIETTPRWWTL